MTGLQGIGPGGVCFGLATRAEAHLFVRAITEWLIGRLAAAAQRAALLDAFLAEIVVQAQASSERDRTVLDNGNRNFARPIRRGRIGYFLDSP